MKIIAYKEAFNLINVEYNEKAKSIVKRLNEEGYREKSICYCIQKSYEKIMTYRYDSRFWSILCNEVRKHGFRNSIKKNAIR
jgi:hypothetical protein